MLNQNDEPTCPKPCPKCGTINWIGSKVCYNCQTPISLGGFIELRIEERFLLMMEIQRRKGLAPTPSQEKSQCDQDCEDE